MSQGGNTPASAGTGGSGSGQRLRIEPDKIVQAKQAFQEALDSVNKHIKSIESAHQVPWANDPVSTDTAAAFNNITTGDHPQSAVQVLTSYANQLSSAVTSLDLAERAYRTTEGDNADSLRGTGVTGA
ncbi:MAG: PE domain-containing protein [Sciscionella sp.]|nr:PE domain-containing protein [Sciscionella sp.]